MQHKSSPARPRGRYLNRWKPVLVIAGYSCLMLYLAGQAPARQSATARQQPAKAEYATPQKTEVPALRPIPGAGKTAAPAELAKIIDAEIALRLAQDKVPASKLCDDSEFIRRVYLDVTGVIPPVEKVTAFLESSDLAKREKLIDTLLQEPGYAKQMAEIWTHLLIPQDSNNRVLAVEPLYKWLEAGFSKNKPWSRIVEEVVTASGTTEANGATTFFVGNPSPDKMTDQVTKLFLGVQLQCAQCHNHPFTNWKQDEYWGMAAFFLKVKQTGSPKQAAKDGSSISITEETGAMKGVGKKKGALPESAKILPPKFLGAERPSIDRFSPARPVLAKWMISDKNPYFARAAVNRLWAHFFGRGFVNPIDDMHDANPATHPELLIALSEQFKRNNYDVQYLVRSMLLSETYQRTSRPTSGNETDAELFSRMYVKTMSPEQLFDSISLVVGNLPPGKGPKAAPGAAKKGGGGTPRQQFVRFFGIDEGGDPLEYQDGIPQALRLMNSPMLNAGGKALEEALKKKSNLEAIDYLYLSTLARHPNAIEADRLAIHANQAGNRRMGYSDILWALLNSSEFRLNH
jgi:hypothetical protein